MIPVRYWDFIRYPGMDATEHEDWTKRIRVSDEEQALLDIGGGQRSGWRAVHLAQAGYLASVGRWKDWEVRMTPTWHPCAEGEKLYQAYCAVTNTDWRTLDTATAPSHEVIVAWNAWLEHVEHCENCRIELR